MSNSPLDSPLNMSASDGNSYLVDPKYLGTDPKSVKAQILQEAMSIVCKDRNEAYGDPEDNFRNIALFWEWYLKMVMASPDYMGLASWHVADMMILMKVARNLHKPKRDNYVDIAGYAACGAEAAKV